MALHQRIKGRSLLLVALLAVAIVGVASLSTAMAWSGRRLAALVPGLLLYMFPAVVVQIATGGEVGWLIRVPATEWWALPAVAAEAGLMFGPVLVPGGGSRISAAERALALGLIGTPAITMAWLLAVFTGPTVLDVAVMCASAIAVLAAGVLSDPSLTPALWLAALGTAVTVRAIDLGASWPAVATLCLAAGVIAAGAAPQLWAGRHRRMRLGFLGV